LLGSLLAVCVIGAGLIAAGPLSAQLPASTAVVSAIAKAPAHTLTAARTHAVVPRGSWQKDKLVRKSQKNWYRLELTSRSYVYTLLGSLPANYNLGLYDDAGKVIAKSDRGKLRPETVGRTLTPGTYFLRVASTSGSSASKKYALLVKVVPASATVGVLTARVDNSGLVVGDLVNVSKRRLTVAYLDVTFYGSHGKLLRRYRDTFNELFIPMAAGARVPFKASTSDVPESVLKKTTRVTAVPRWSVMEPRSAPKLSVSHVKRTNVHHTGWTEIKVKGRIHNASNRTVEYAIAVFEVHDKRGVLLGLETDFHRLPSKATKTFRTDYFSWTSNPATTVKAFETVDVVPDPE
jgi:hypothetical protein